MCKRRGTRLVLPDEGLEGLSWKYIEGLRENIKRFRENIERLKREVYKEFSTWSPKRLAKYFIEATEDQRDLIDDYLEKRAPSNYREKVRRHLDERP